MKFVDIALTAFVTFFFTALICLGIGTKLGRDEIKCQAVIRDKAEWVATNAGDVEFKWKAP